MTIRGMSAVAMAAACASAVPALSWAACESSQPDRTPTSRYVITGDEVYDTKTELTWQRCSLGQRWKDGRGCVGVIQTMSWDQAMRQRNGNWRLPTKDELLSLAASNCRNPSINEEVFPDMDLQRPWYWSSTEFNATDAWVINFGVGHAPGSARTFAYSIRLVRNGR